MLAEDNTAEENILKLKGERNRRPSVGRKMADDESATQIVLRFLREFDAYCQFRMEKYQPQRHIEYHHSNETSASQEATGPETADRRRTGKVDLEERGKQRRIRFMEKGQSSFNKKRP
eukprot:gb/GECG01013417.1/.p1 GENE.gb/GECG01013417.1/~~gb/GECG01013417.1/.p1  ORF type:complete len:118 (+),score=23.20 gb/GECG01013417.1/:1-354(+)